PSACAPELLAGQAEIVRLINDVRERGLSPSASLELELAMRTKEAQFRAATNEALGVSFEVTADPPGPPPGPSYFPRLEQTTSVAIPDHSFTVTARLYNRGAIPVTPRNVRIEAPEGWTVTRVTPEEQKPLASGDVAAVQFKIAVPKDAPYTQPYFYRRNPETETVYMIGDPKLITEPWPSYPLRAEARFSAAGLPGEVNGVAKIKFVGPTLGQSELPLILAPPLSVLPPSPLFLAP